MIIGFIGPARRARVDLSRGCAVARRHTRVGGVWVHRYEQEGPGGLTEGVRSGRPGRLHEEQIQEINRVLRAKPGDAGMVVKGKVNGPKYIEFLQRLIPNAPPPIFLIVDGHPVHKARTVKDFVASTEGRLRLFYLPPCAPELNPDEQVWNHVK